MLTSMNECKKSGEETGKNKRIIDEKIGGKMLQGEQLLKYANEAYDTMASSVSNLYFKSDVEQRSAWTLGFITGYVPDMPKRRNKDECPSFGQNFWDLMHSLFGSE